MYELLVLPGPDKDGHRYRFSLLDNLEFLPYQPIVDWCVENFGSNSPIPRGSRWMVAGNGFFFYFRDEDDAFAFRMRWC